MPHTQSTWQDVVTHYDVDTNQIETSLSMPCLCSLSLVHEALSCRFQRQSIYRIDIEQRLLVRYLGIAP